MVELALFVLHEAAEHVHEVPAHGAAQTSVVQENYILLAAVFERDQVAVDVDLAELVLDDDDALAVITLQYVVEQRRLAGPARERGGFD